MSDKQRRIELEQNVNDRVSFFTETGSIEASETVVRASITADAVLTLPSMEKAAGRFYSIYLVDEGVSKVLDIYGKESAASVIGEYHLVEDDNVLLYCDGYRWVVVDSTITAD